MEVHTGPEILAHPALPMLTRKKYQTVSSAYHSIFYNGKLAKWNFSESVQHVVSEYCNSKEPLSSKVYRVSDNLCSIDHEHYLCGDEQSVCGRFAQNVLGPTTAVAFANGIMTRFGDFKVSAEAKGEKTLIPDFVAVHCPAYDFKGLADLTEKPQLRFVGEAKTPWNHDLEDSYNRYFVQGKQSFLRRALGQIAQYMHRYKMKYGFLTTHDHTIFLKQEIPSGESGFCLYVSPPIAASAVPAPNTSEKRFVVSVRQCFYYLLCATNRPGSYTANNPMPPQDWVDDKSPHWQGLTHTPAGGKIDTPGGIIEHMSPRVGRTYSDRGSIELHSTSSSEMLTAVLQFHPAQVVKERGTTYVVIKGQKVPVHITTHKPNEGNPSSGEEDRHKPTPEFLSAFSSGPQRQQGRIDLSRNYPAGKPSRLTEKFMAMEDQAYDASHDDMPSSDSVSQVETPSRKPPQHRGYPSLGSSSSRSRPAPSASQSPSREPPRAQEMTLPHRPSRGSDKAKSLGGDDPKGKGKSKVTFGSGAEEGDDSKHGRVKKGRKQ
ncbi:hypothetical protein MauCBS54593_003311 [Microsporum audouinii]